jgi:hypothetical protein
MKFAFSVFLVLTFTACSSLRSTSILPSQTNTSSAALFSAIHSLGTAWLPVHQGNTWTFDDGTRFVDAGSVQDPFFGFAEEKVNVERPSASSPFLSFIFSYVLDSNGNPLPEAFSLVSISNARASDFFQDFRVTEGWMLVDFDRVRMHETFTCDEFSFSPEGCLIPNSATATIVAVHRTVKISSGRLHDVDTEVDTIPTNVIPSGRITWSFAKGVGFTKYSDGTLNLHLVSYSLTQ